jgi:hypothetical protein
MTFESRYFFSIFKIHQQHLSIVSFNLQKKFNLASSESRVAYLINTHY